MGYIFFFIRATKFCHILSVAYSCIFFAICCCVRVGIAFALLAHPCLWYPLQEISNHLWRCLPSSLLLGSGLASLCSPIPVWGSFARNQQPPLVFVPDFRFVCFGSPFVGVGDWLRFARPSLLGYPLQEISNHLAVFVLILFYMSTGK